MLKSPVHGDLFGTVASFGPLPPTSIKRPLTRTTPSGRAIIVGKLSTFLILRQYVHAKGYRTIESDSAEEGIKLAEERKPALILMDIQLPGMDGITALKRLKANPAMRTIPVMAITASAMSYNRESMLAEGFDGYQIKPFNLREFLANIEELIS